MKYWEEIRKYRHDITNYLIHWTKDLPTLARILECGYLIPTFAPKYSKFARERRNTIQGSIPAVCFTEQPLDCFVKACEVRPERYKPYGVVLHKYALYSYGGRPVCYGDKRALKALDDAHKYLWVQYDPIPGTDGYPLDFSHEREWRCIVNTRPQYGFDVLPAEGIPILLPWDASCNHSEYKFRILVSMEDDAQIVRAYVQALQPPSGQSKLLDTYFKRLSETQILALEAVRKYVETSQIGSIRFEDLSFLTPEQRIKMGLGEEAIADEQP